MRIYLSGPMSGWPESNYPAFDAAAAALRAMGHYVLSPAENFGGDANRSYAEYMRLDIQMVLDVEAVVVLPWWWTSRGACLECAIARVLQLPILDFETMALAEEPPFAEIEHVLGQMVRWGIETFQPNGEDRLQSATTHLVKEARELAAAPRDMEEVADCFMLLAHIVKMNGGSASRAIAAKLAKNRTRSWTTRDDGTIEHVRDTEAA